MVFAGFADTIKSLSSSFRKSEDKVETVTEVADVDEKMRDTERNESNETQNTSMGKTTVRKERKMRVTVHSSVPQLQTDETPQSGTSSATDDATTTPFTPAMLAAVTSEQIEQETVTTTVTTTTTVTSTTGSEHAPAESAGESGHTSEVWELPDIHPLNPNCCPVLLLGDPLVKKLIIAQDTITEEDKHRLSLIYPTKTFHELLHIFNFGNRPLPQLEKSVAAKADIVSMNNSALEVPPPHMDVMEIDEDLLLQLDLPPPDADFPEFMDEVNLAQDPTLEMNFHRMPQKEIPRKTTIRKKRKKSKDDFTPPKRTDRIKSKSKRFVSNDAQARVEKIRKSGLQYVGDPKRRDNYPLFRDVTVTDEVPFEAHLSKVRQDEFNSQTVTAEDRAILAQVDKKKWAVAETRTDEKDGPKYHMRLYYGDFAKHRMKTFEGGRKRMRDLHIHNSTMAAIDCGTAGKCAAAFCCNGSGGYVSTDYGRVMVASGQGGRIYLCGDEDEWVVENQCIEKTGNNALFESFVHRVPIRMVRGPKLQSKYRPKGNVNPYAYHGLYVITGVLCTKLKYETPDTRDAHGLVYKFRFVQLEDEPIPENDNPIPQKVAYSSTRLDFERRMGMDTGETTIKKRKATSQPRRSKIKRKVSTFDEEAAWEEESAMSDFSMGDMEDLSPIPASSPGRSESQPSSPLLDASSSDEEAAESDSSSSSGEVILVSTTPPVITTSKPTTIKKRRKI